MKPADERALKEANKVYGHRDDKSPVREIVIMISVVAFIAVMLLANC